MRHVMFAVLSMGLVSVSTGVNARELAANDRYMCNWGAGTAAKAQELKLAGVSLYAARRKLQTYRFSKPWMRMMAMGITEQTYDSPTRIKPATLRKSFYDDCVRFKMARK